MFGNCGTTFFFSKSIFCAIWCHSWETQLFRSLWTPLILAMAQFTPV